MTALRRKSVGGPPTSPDPGLGFGTAPVFLASVSTILGAILFLRFGYAVAHVGLLGTLGIIVLGHLVTIPTVLAVSEIATNRRVAGGGAYYIISRSFGPSIGGSIGIALYLSQAISVAFYLVAFAEAFEPAYEWAAATYGMDPDPRWVSLPSTVLLVALILTKGADLGVRVLWVVSAILAASIAAFLLGSGPESIRPDGLNLTARIQGGDSFGTVFATCFPAFTGMIAGLGLSGDLRNPEKSIPLGTIGATLTGMVVYAVVAVKLAQSATPEALAADQFVMAQIAWWGPAIHIGLAAAAVSSALGSILVAPRTLQALARDDVLAVPKLNRILEAGRGAGNEPVIATYVSSAIAVVFVALGDVDFIAQILSMFFMVTYGTLCAVSFLEYFAGNPSYRPTFRSRWYLSLIGALMCGVLMIQMSVLYAFLAISLMVAIYYGLRRTRKDGRDLTAIFQGTMFQLTRRLQIKLQQNRVTRAQGGWRPSVVAITRFGARRVGHFDLLRWISQRHGFGHFIQYREGEYTFAEESEAQIDVDKLIQRTADSKAEVFVDALISPSFRTAVGQSLQMPGISGLPNNCVLLEFFMQHSDEVDETVQAARIATGSMFNALILRSTPFRFGYRSKIDIWITERDTDDNARLMLLLAYIIVGHADWKRAKIRLFAYVDEGNSEREADKLSALMKGGRLPIPRKNLTTIRPGAGTSLESEVKRHSSDTDLLIAGLPATDLDSEMAAQALLHGFEGANDVLFVHASETVAME